MTLHAPNATRSLFALPHLGTGTERDSFAIPSLDKIANHFALPGFDEYGAGRDRVLESLAAARLPFIDTAGPRQEDGNGKGKGKERVAVPAIDEVDQCRTRDLEGQDVEYFRRIAERMGSEPGPSRPRAFKPLRTWDTVNGDTDAYCHPFASGRSHEVFEAINIITETPPSVPALKSRPHPPPADSAELLSLLIRATTGTTTTESLQWDRRKSRYTWGGKGERVEGISGTSSAASVRDFLDVATALRRLEDLLDRETRNLHTPTHHALLHAVSTYLTFIKQRLTNAIAESEKEEVSGWNKWSAGLRDVRELLQTLVEVMGWRLTETKATPIHSRPSSLLSHIYAHLLAEHLSSPPSSPPTSIATCLAYLLQASSTPILDLLHAWVGLSDSSAEVAATSEKDQPWQDLGITRTKRKIRGTDAGEAILWDYDFSSKRMPAFIPKESRRRLFEAGRSLRLLREANGDHPLSGGGWGLEGRWGWGEESIDMSEDIRHHVKRVRRETEHWRRSVRNRTRPLSGTSSMIRLSAGKERKRIPAEFMAASTSTRHSVAGSALSTHDTPIASNGLNSTQPTSSEAIEDHLKLFLQSLDLAPGTKAASAPTTSIWTSTPLDALHAFLAYHARQPLLPPSHPTFSLFISNHLLAPLLAHGELVSAALVSLYLDDLHLLDHLDVLSSFWLGGDVGFFERVSAALFATDLDVEEQAVGMGRRARTRARMGLPAAAAGGMATGIEADWGIALGVGLSDRQRWPPGGAELAYALRTTLIDDRGGYAGGRRDGEVWQEIEDRVSFAIKPLPEDDEHVRAKWLDPQGMEALDFLYLVYSPPPSISVVLPRDILDKYQTIHNFLLRLCRVDAVIRSMFHDLHKPFEAAEELGKSGVDMPRSRRRQAIGVRNCSTILSTDQPLYGVVLRLKFRMSHFVSALMGYVIDIAIGANWERMRRRLDKLRRRDKANQGAYSRPESPTDDRFSEFGDTSPPPEIGELDDDEDGADEEDHEPIHQLKSVHSLVAYHHLTLDRILRACLLSTSAGYEVTYKLLMRLCGLVLDLGKVVKQVERQMIAIQEAKPRMMGIKKEWEEKEHVFMRALERLSQKSTKGVQPDAAHSGDQEQDLELLLQDEREDEAGAGVSAGQNNLAELLIRLRSDYGVEDSPKRGRYQEV